MDFTSESGEARFIPRQGRIAFIYSVFKSLIPALHLGALARCTL
jgi:hypothetical protein